MNMKCTVCDSTYDDTQSRCPKCATKNPLLREDSFLRIEIEMESSLYRAVQRESKGMSPEAFIVTAVEHYITHLGKRKVTA